MGEKKVPTQPHHYARYYTHHVITYLKNGIVFSFSPPFRGNDAAAVGCPHGAAATFDGADVFMVLMDSPLLRK